MIPPVCRARVEIIVSGRRLRALQYPPVSVLPGFRPPITRLTMASSTTCRQLPSADNAWARNIDKVSVGGNSRSRCSGSNASTRSNSCGTLSRLNIAEQSVLLA